MRSEMEQLRILIGERDASDDEEVATQTGRLRRNLLELDVEDVRHVSAGPPPAGARAGDMLEIGTLLVALVRAPHIVSSVAQVLSAWISTRNGRSVTVVLNDERIELSGVARDDQRRMMRLFEREVAG
jgi:hypothetical protein